MDKRGVHHLRISRSSSCRRRKGMELRGTETVLRGVVEVGIDGDALL
jgi:hypothetical protein